MDKEIEVNVCKYSKLLWQINSSAILVDFRRADHDLKSWAWFGCLKLDTGWPLKMRRVMKQFDFSSLSKFLVSQGEAKEIRGKKSGTWEK